MEGLIMYLTLPAIDAMLSFIVKNSGPGSAILFDCSGKTGSHDSMTRKKSKIIRHKAVNRSGFSSRKKVLKHSWYREVSRRSLAVTCDECR